MNYTPEKGDIILLDFDPSSGKEIMKRRPALVLSRKIFNENAEMAVVAPITSTIRNVDIEVVLPDGLKTQGAILLYQLKSIDFIERNVAFVEKSPTDIIDKASKIAKLILT